MKKENMKQISAESRGGDTARNRGMTKAIPYRSYELEIASLRSQ